MLLINVKLFWSHTRKPTNYLLIGSCWHTIIKLHLWCYPMISSFGFSGISVSLSARAEVVHIDWILINSRLCAVRWESSSKVQRNRCEKRCPDAIKDEFYQQLTVLQKVCPTNIILLASMKAVLLYACNIWPLKLRILGGSLSSIISVSKRLPTFSGNTILIIWMFGSVRSGTVSTFQSITPSWNTDFSGLDVY